MKVCIRCQMKLPLEAFGRRSTSPDGLESACRACELERIHWWKHGMTTLQKEGLATGQNGCAICGRAEPGAWGWVIDHDHSCCPGDRSCASCRRGVLCHRCNTALGYANDNPSILRRMADYIELGTRIGDSHPGFPGRTPTTDSYERDELTEKGMAEYQRYLQLSDARARIRRSEVADG